jgi:hypothetical protein
MELDDNKNPFIKGRKHAVCTMQRNNQSWRKMQKYDHKSQWLLLFAPKPSRRGAAAKQRRSAFQWQANGTRAMFGNHQKGHVVHSDDLQPEWEMLATRWGLKVI